MTSTKGYRLALVEYLNTYPFSEGLKLMGLNGQLTVHRVPPAVCAQMFKAGEVDISLCPVGALNEMGEYEIRGNYCIGAEGKVWTVALLSKVPLEEIRSVRLDDHSRTSNELLQILAQHHWHKDWTYYFDHSDTLPESCLMIGDKVFANKDAYPYTYDLGEAWQELTGLPMVFAVWITRPGVPAEVVELIDRAFELGHDHIQSAQSDLAPWQKEYLLDYISYPLDSAKQKALRLFQSLAD